MAADDQEKFLKEATAAVKKNAYFMQKAMVRAQGGRAHAHLLLSKRGAAC
jgi:hypothetical protein